jgi:hypothetical protein
LIKTLDFDQQQGKANFFPVADNEPHPGCTCEGGFTGDHCEFLKSNDSGSSSGSSAGAAVGPSTNTSTVDSANQNLVIGIASVLIGILFVAGFFVARALLVGGKKTSGKTAAEAGDAVAEAELETSGTNSLQYSDSAGKPFDEASQTQSVPQPMPTRFEEGDEEFEDVEDYSNDQSDASTLTEDDMSHVEIV